MTTPGRNTKITVKKNVKKVNVTETPPTEVSIQAKGARGPKGDTGDDSVTPGPQGPVGPAGPPGSALQAYRHVQTPVSSVWPVPHNLGFRPNASVYDSGGTQIEGFEIQHVDDNNLNLIFLSAFSGTADLS